MRRLSLLAAAIVAGCGTGVGGPECPPHPPPRIVSAIVTGRVADLAGDSLPDADVVLEVVWAATAADTVGACEPFGSDELAATIDASGRFREKLISVFSGFACVRARGERGGLTGVSELRKLELRGDLGPECTPESSLDSAELHVVIGP